jgi:hypothetical protein
MNLRSLDHPVACPDENEIFYPIAQFLLIIVGIGSAVATWRYYHRRRQLLEMHQMDP